MAKKEHGFTIVEALLAVLIIAVLSFGGYYVWHSKKQPAKGPSTASQAATNTQKAQSSASSTTSGASSAAAATPAQSSVQYLTIKEWGVKIPLTTTINDAYYYYKNDYAYLSLQSLASTDCSATATTLGVISRYTAGETDPQTGELYSAEITGAANVGQYYYYYTHPQADCSTNQTVLDKANSAMSAFKTAVANTQAE